MPPGGMTNSPLVLMRLTTKSWEADTTGNTSCDSARLVQWWYGISDTAVQDGDTTPWFYVGQDTVSDTDWRFLHGEGQYRFFVQVKDSWSMSELIADSSEPVVVFDTTAPAGSITINGGDRFATSQTCSLAYTATDAGAGVKALRLGNGRLANLVADPCFSNQEGPWKYSTNGQRNSELAMAELAAGPTQAESVWQTLPPDSLEPYFGDTVRLCADLLVRAPEDESAGLGVLSLRYRFANDNPQVGDSLCTLAEVEFDRGLGAHVGLSSLEDTLLLPEPAPEHGWTFEGADVQVRIENGNNPEARAWADNVHLCPSGPQPEFSWWQACDTAGIKAWDLGDEDGYKTVWLSLLDSAGVERSQLLSDSIILDATVPVADIMEPDEGAYVNGVVDITGWAFDSVTVDDDSMFESYRLYYKHADSSQWLPVDPDSVSYDPAPPDTMTPGNYANNLGQWNTGGLAEGEYFLLLTVVDSAGNSSSDETWVVVDDDGIPDGEGEGAQGGGSGMGEGSVYVGSMTGNVVHYDEDLDSLEAFSVSDSGGPAYVSALLKLDEDSLLVLDARNRAIHKLGRNGQNRRRLVSNLGLPAALTKDANGNIWLCDKGSGRVAKFRPNGTLVFAKTKGEGDTLNLNQPMALGATGQLAYIADSRNNRLAVWDSVGTYLRSIRVARPQAVVPWGQ
jgi:hypothetical protein